MARLMKANDTGILGVVAGDYGWPAAFGRQRRDLTWGMVIPCDGHMELAPAL